MADVTTQQAADFVKLIGSSASGLNTNPADVSANGDLGTIDGLSGGGTQVFLAIVTANTPVELKCGASRLNNRKLITFQATTSDFYWGYTNAVTGGPTGSGTLINKGATAKWSIDPAAATQAQIWLVAIVSSASGGGKATESP